MNRLLLEDLKEQSDVFSLLAIPSESYEEITRLLNFFFSVYSKKLLYEFLQILHCLLEEKKYKKTRQGT